MREGETEKEPPFRHSAVKRPTMAAPAQAAQQTAQGGWPAQRSRRRRLAWAGKQELPPVQSTRRCIALPKPICAHIWDHLRPLEYPPTKCVLSVRCHNGKQESYMRDGLCKWPARYLQHDHHGKRYNSQPLPSIQISEVLRIHPATQMCHKYNHATQP